MITEEVSPSSLARLVGKIGRRQPDNNFDGDAEGEIDIPITLPEIVKSTSGNTNHMVTKMRKTFANTPRLLIFSLWLLAVCGKFNY